MNTVDMKMMMDKLAERKVKDLDFQDWQILADVMNQTGKVRVAEEMCMYFHAHKHYERDEDAQEDI